MYDDAQAFINGINHNPIYLIFVPCKYVWEIFIHFYQICMGDIYTFLPNMYGGYLYMFTKYVWGIFIHV